MYNSQSHMSSGNSYNDDTQFSSHSQSNAEQGSTQGLVLEIKTGL
jgi:hypothetical protein